MATERLTEATAYDPSTNVIATSEAHILRDGKADTLFADVDNVHLEIAGYQNFNVYADALDDLTHDDLTLHDRIDATLLYDKWRTHLLRREIAIRSIELSLLTSVETDDITEYLMAASQDSMFDKPLSLLHRNKPSGRLIKKHVKKSLDNGESLGDVMAQLRLQVDDSAMASAFMLAGKIGLGVNAISQPRSFNQHARKKHKQILSEYTAAPKGIRKTDAGLIEGNAHLGLIHEARLPDDMLTPFEFARDSVQSLMERRRKLAAYELPTSPRGQYQYTPSNIDLYEKLAPLPAAAEKQPIIIRSAANELDPKKAAEKSQAERERLQALEAERQRVEQESKREIEAYNAPILAELTRLKSQYNELLAPFLSPPKRALREHGIIGKNSLSYAISRLDDQDIDSASRIANVYSYIKELATDHSDNADRELRDILLEVERLHAEYMTFLHENPLKNGAAARQEPIDEGVKAELGWLTTHWDEFVGALQNSSHSKAVTESELASVATLLGVQLPATHEEPSSEAESEANVEVETPEPVEDADEFEEFLEEINTVEKPEEEPRLSALATANRLAEQLSWVVLPNEHITPDDLVETAKKVSGERSKDGKPATIERYRMEALLKLREEFGGTLYRSDERTLGDSDNLYFVLRFEHDGDGNCYAVAENPVYGNATYVLREDALPLMPGESVLAALKLRRSDVSSIGAERIIHGTPDAATHLEKIDAKLVGLSKRERVAAQ